MTETTTVATTWICHHCGQHRLHLTTTHDCACDDFIDGDQ